MKLWQMLLGSVVTTQGCFALVAEQVIATEVDFVYFSGLESNSEYLVLTDDLVSDTVDNSVYLHFWYNGSKIQGDALRAQVISEGEGFGYGNNNTVNSYIYLGSPSPPRPQIGQFTFRAGPGNTLWFARGEAFPSPNDPNYSTRQSYGAVAQGHFLAASESKVFDAISIEPAGNGTLLSGRIRLFKVLTN